MDLHMKDEMVENLEEEPRSSLTEVLVQLVRYAAFGVLCSAIDTAIFWYFTSGGGYNPLWVNVFSTAMGVSTSFYFNRRYTFKVHDHPAKRYIAFFSIGIAGLVCSEAIIWAGTLKLPHLAPVWIKLLAVSFVGSFQFFLNRNISFRTALGASGDDDDIV